MENSIDKTLKAWGVLQKNRMISRVVQMQLKDKVALRKRVLNRANNPEYKVLSNSIKFGVKSDFGVINRINFRFAKQGIWFEHGVGRNRLVRSANATPHPYLSVVLNNSIEGLAVILADDMADYAVSEIKFLIPGIVDTKIKVNNG